MVTKVEKKPLNKNAQKWVQALRSGKYKQTKSVLRYESRFCCLGVACEVYNQEMKRLHKKQLKTIITDGKVVAYDNCEQILPLKVQHWLNLSTRDGDFGDGDLVEMNDNGKTFRQIARVIERQPENLFKD